MITFTWMGNWGTKQARGCFKKSADLGATCSCGKTNGVETRTQVFWSTLHVLAFDVQSPSEGTWAGTSPGARAQLCGWGSSSVFGSCNSSVCAVGSGGSSWAHPSVCRHRGAGHGGVSVQTALRWPGSQPVCASSLCTCQTQGQKVCFYRAKALWKCWHSCRRIKYFLPQQWGVLMILQQRGFPQISAGRGCCSGLQEGNVCSHTS